jgi:hypothetical protein
MTSNQLQRLREENRQLQRDNGLYRQYINNYLQKENSEYTDIGQTTEELLDKFRIYADHHQKYAYYQNKEFEKMLEITETDTDGESNYENWITIKKQLDKVKDQQNRFKEISEQLGKLKEQYNKEKDQIKEIILEIDPKITRRHEMIKRIKNWVTQKKAESINTTQIQKSLQATIQFLLQLNQQQSQIIITTGDYCPIHNN